MKNRIIYGLLAAVVATGIFAGCGSSQTVESKSVENKTEEVSEQAEKSEEETAETTEENTDSTNNTGGTTVRVGVQATEYVQYLEAEYGYFTEAFEENGAEIEFINFESGPAITEALASDSLDIGFLGELPVLTAASAGNPIKIIGSGASSMNGIALIVPEGSDITSLEQLKGKTVAFTVGTAGHEFIINAMESVGLGESDINGLNVANPNIEATLLSGDVDAVVTVGPFIYKIENTNEGHVLVDNTDIYKPVSSIIAGQTFLDNYPELAKLFLQTWHEVAGFATENREEVEQVLAARQDTDLEYFKRFEVAFEDGWTEEKTETLKTTEKFLLDHDLVAEEIDPESIVDTSYLP